jgi:DNA-binding FrmR family transcriptional regulator
MKTVMNTTNIHTTLKQTAGARLRRAAGQVRGVSRMIEADAALADVVVQITAVEAALAAVRRIVLTEVLRSGDTTTLERLL